MKTVHKLKCYLILCLVFLGYVFFNMEESRHNIEKKLSEETELWQQNQLWNDKRVDLNDIKWDGIIRFKNGRYEAESNMYQQEEEIELGPDLPPELEVIVPLDEELKDIRESHKMHVNQFFEYGEKIETFDTGEEQIRFIPEEEKTNSLMFKPSGLRYLVEQQAMPFFKSDQCPVNFVADEEMPVLDTLRQCIHSSPYPPEVEQWFYTQVIQCSGHLSIFNREMAMLQDVILDKTHSAVMAKETYYSELNKAKYTADGADGQLHIELGYFKIYCPSGLNKMSYAFRGGSYNHLSRWYYVTEEFNNPMAIDYVVSQVTIAVSRYQAENLYQTMGNIYNAYLAMKFFNVTADTVMILLLDANEYTPLDSIWSRLFHFTLDLSGINTRTHFYTLIWNAVGHQSHFHMPGLNSLPYIHEFTTFILDRYGISYQKSLSCRQLTITIIIRRDYVDYSGKIKKNIDRKITNEEEMLFKLRKYFSNDQVNVTQMELLPMNSQLYLMAKTDILIGVHGAGLTHALFLPSHAGVLELFPATWNKPSGQNKAICHWRNLIYDTWREDDLNEYENELKFQHNVHVNAEAVADRVQRIKNEMCAKRLK